MCLLGVRHCANNSTFNLLFALVTLCPCSKVFDHFHYQQDKIVTLSSGGLIGSSPPRDSPAATGIPSLEPTDAPLTAHPCSPIFSLPVMLPLPMQAPPPPVSFLYLVNWIAFSDEVVSWWLFPSSSLNTCAPWRTGREVLLRASTYWRT